MLTAASLSTIIALARAGALDHAWYEFRAAGYDARDDDPAALTVKGRLLKDKALRASGEARRKFYLESAEAYRRSAELVPATYPLINAATLSLLSGDRGQAEEIAREVLERIAREPDEPETPYWRAATEAEALLLLGRADDARAALAAALAAAPRAWEDHGSTLRQFELIHAALGADAGWLDLLRPPQSAAYAGRLAIADAAAEAELAAAVAAALDEERVGFAFGGLSAGAELVAAEALLARGVELHVVLPGDGAGFAERFVDPYGDGWRRRFDAALDAAETVEQVRPLAVPDSRMAALADEVALGTALLNSERLMSAAVALRLDGSAGAARWRVRPVAPPAGAQAMAVEDSPDLRAQPLALLALGVGSGGEAGFEDRLEDAQGVVELAAGAAVAPHLSGDVILVGLAEPGEAAEAARAIHAELRGRMPLRIAGHYGLTPVVRDPFTGALRPTESGAAIARAIAASIPPDTLCVSGDFAAVLTARADAPGEANWIGELEAKDGGSPVALYALRRDAAS